MTCKALLLLCSWPSYVMPSSFVLMAKLCHACHLSISKAGCERHTQAADNVADLFWKWKVLTEVTAEVYMHLTRLSSKHQLVV